MPRGRPSKKKPPEDEPIDDNIVETPQDADLEAKRKALLDVPIEQFMNPSFDLPGIAPRKIKGEYNPAYFADVLDITNRSVFRAMLTGEKVNHPFVSFQAGILKEAEIAGIMSRAVLDRRTEGDKANDAATMLTSGDKTPWEIFDQEMAAVEWAFNNADKGTMEYLEKKFEGREDDPCSPKSWRLRIKRVRNLRLRARNAIPPVHSGAMTGNHYIDKVRPGLLKAAQEAAHPLRFMAYVGRASMDLDKARDQETTPDRLVFDISDHLVKAACDIWIAKNGVKFYKDSKTDTVVYQKGVIPYEYCVLLMPVGHGKTELCVHYCGLQIGLNPRIQGMYLHAVDDMASANLAAIKRFFDPKEEVGRRFLSLFPLELAKRDNNESKLRVKVPNSPKSPTFISCGTNTAKLSADSEFQVWDDIVPQSDAEQPTERERRIRTIMGTFSTRQRNKHPFTLVVATPWHIGDAVMHLVEQARTNVSSRGSRGIVAYVSIQRCGGPKDTPAFKPLWPKVKDTASLRRTYNKLGPSLYSAAMMMNPMSDEQRIVKKIRLYDPSTEEHKKFLDSSVKYISLDPAATKESRSDKAGIGYGGMGTVRIEREIDGRKTIDTEKRFRWLAVHEIHATQSDLTQFVMDVARVVPVDYVMVEAVSGFKGIVEMFEGLGIDAIALHPGGKSKENRLRSVAPMLEDTNAMQGFRAICEFPGIMQDGKLVLDPAFKGIVEQIVDFGACASDHLVDMCTQCLNHLAPDLGIGRGVVSKQVKAIDQELGDPRLIAMYKAYERQAKEARNGSIEQEEDKWIRSNWQL